MNLELRDKKDCKYDAVSLGEVMLRLDPGEGRIRTARQFRAWEGGGEYNVIRGLRRCFGMDTAVITAFADNEVGHLVEDFIMQGGVDTIKPYVDDFISFAQAHPELRFLVTRIGCGIAGFKDEEIATLFRKALSLDNIVLPYEFVKVLGK